MPLEEELKKPLNVPEDRHLSTLVPVGVPVEWLAVEKKPLEKVIHWETYTK